MSFQFVQNVNIQIFHNMLFVYRVLKFIVYLEKCNSIQFGMIKFNQFKIDDHANVFQLYFISMQTYFKEMFEKIIRSRQGSNLRGETPLDFKSNALTTRPRLLVVALQ